MAFLQRKWEQRIQEVVSLAAYTARRARVSSRGGEKGVPKIHIPRCISQDEALYVLSKEALVSREACVYISSHKFKHDIDGEILRNGQRIRLRLFDGSGPFAGPPKERRHGAFPGTFPERPRHALKGRVSSTRVTKRRAMVCSTTRRADKFDDRL